MKRFLHSILIVFTLLIFSSKSSAHEGNIEKAKENLKKGALLGFMEAELELGENFWNGWDGFEKDPSEGKYWLKKAHENGSKDAEDVCGCSF